MAAYRLSTPLTAEALVALRCGDQALLSGVVYAARDCAHRRMIEALERGESLPFKPEGAAIYYVGPTPAPFGLVIGSAGPTTSGRMDAYAPKLYDLGVKATIGKGRRNVLVREAMVRNQAVYLAATGGAGALLAEHIVRASVIAFPDLGPEAVMELVFEDFPTIVANDILGNELYPPVHI